MVIVKPGPNVPGLARGRIPDPEVAWCLGPVRETEKVFVFPDRPLFLESSWRFMYEPGFVFYRLRYQS